jgi:hypothetical protein
VGGILTIAKHGEGSGALGLLGFGLAEDKAARLANQDGVALRTDNVHVRLKNGDVMLRIARFEGPAALVANQRLFTEAAFHDQRFVRVRRE